MDTKKFNLEELTYENQSYWEQYRTKVTFLSSSGDAFKSIIPISKVVSLILEGLPINDPYWTDDVEIFEVLKINILKNKPSIKQLETLNRAASGMNVRKQTYIGYYSTDQIYQATKSLRTFGDFVRRYGHILISVGTTATDIIENRGVFRNPWSIITTQGTGLSLSLHAKICKEISLINPNVNILKIRPLQAMKKIILEKVKNITHEGDLTNENEWYEPTLYIPFDSILEHLIE